MTMGHYKKSGLQVQKKTWSIELLFTLKRKFHHCTIKDRHQFRVKEWKRYHKQIDLRSKPV